MILGVGGMGGHAETCCKHTATRQRTSRTPSQLHDVVAVAAGSGNGKEFQTLEISDFANSRNSVVGGGVSGYILCYLGDIFSNTLHTPWP